MTETNMMADNTALPAMSRLINEILQLGEDINVEVNHMAKMIIDNARLSTQIEARKQQLAPPEGWAGSNETTRSISREKTFAADEELQKIVTELRIESEKLEAKKAFLAGLEAKRRSFEWAIRAMGIVGSLPTDYDNATLPF